MEDEEIATSSDPSEGVLPSRHELLTIVRRHSKFLKDGMVDEDDRSDIEMDVKFWNEMLDLYFIRGRESTGCHEDDLIFFVRDMNLHGYGFNDNVESAPPYFVRRWAAKLDKVTGDSYAEVDWRRSFYLNFIAHTSFAVTVAICSIQDLRRHQSGVESSLTPVYKVIKTVYASPSRVNFQVDFRKVSETTPAYPNICFAIEDFDDTFDSVVLSESDHCYCVLLNADGGAAFPSKETPEGDDGSGSVKNMKLTLFSGFVSYQMVRDAYEAGKPRFGNLLSLGSYQGRTDRLFMRGPGGQGEVEVAVSSVPDQSQQNSGPPPLQPSKEGFIMGLGSIIRQAASAASRITQKPDAELLPLKCSLMSVSLPWENIAHDLLFKASPPVKL
ncbi:CW7 isoform X1 [Wolffia australiana]